jgi:hypothetical protein
VAITAAHKGRFSFRICNSTLATTEQCFKQNVLLRCADHARPARSLG